MTRRSLRGQGRRRRGRRDDLLPPRPVAGSGVRAVPEGDPRGLRGRRHRSARHRRLRLLQQRPQRSRRRWRRRWAPTSCASPTCSGAAAAAAARARWPTRRPRSPPGWPTAWSSTGRWPRASSAASARARGVSTVSGDMALTAPYGQMSPAQWYAPKVIRFMHEHGIGQEALRAIAWPPTTTPRPTRAR